MINDEYAMLEKIQLNKDKRNIFLKLYIDYCLCTFHRIKKKVTDKMVEAKN